MFFDRDAHGVSPRTQPQNTDPGAKESLARSGQGALKDAPKVPRAIQDIIDELNTVRQRLSELWAESAVKAFPRRGSVRAEGVMFPAYDAEYVARQKERDKLSGQEDQLRGELQQVIAASRIGPGGDINPQSEG